MSQGRKRRGSKRVVSRDKARAWPILCEGVIGPRETAREVTHQLQQAKKSVPGLRPVRGWKAGAVLLEKLQNVLSSKKGRHLSTVQVPSCAPMGACDRLCRSWTSPGSK